MRKIIISAVLVLLLAATGCYQIPIFYPVDWGTEESEDPTITDMSWFKDPGAVEYTLSTVGDIRGLAELVNAGQDFKGKTINLSSSTYDFSAFPGFQIGGGDRFDTSAEKGSAKTFAGTLNGNGAIIRGLSINGGGTGADDDASFGFIAIAENASINNLVFEDCTVTSNTSATGVAVGYALDSNISNITVKNSSVSSAEAAGAVIGRLYTTGGGNTYTIENCQNIGTSVTVTPSYHAGGIVGYVNPGPIDINTPTEVPTDTVKLIGNEVDLTNGAAISSTNTTENQISAAGGITGSVTMHDASSLAVVFEDNTIRLNSTDQIKASGSPASYVHIGYLYGYERSNEDVDNINIPASAGNKLVLNGVETTIVGPSASVKDGETYHVIYPAEV